VGCGTGRLAARLLKEHLPESARYVGVDLSGTMTDLASTRLAEYASRAEVHQTEGGFVFSTYGDGFDRVVTTYVLDLLSVEDIGECLADAHIALSASAGENGLFCHVGLTTGSGPISRTVSGLWRLVHRVRPLLVGGCRPLTLTDLMPADSWHIVHRTVVVSAGIPSEVVIAQPR